MFRCDKAMGADRNVGNDSGEVPSLTKQEHFTGDSGISLSPFSFVSFVVFFPSGL